MPQAKVVLSFGRRLTPDVFREHAERKLLHGEHNRQ